MNCDFESLAAERLVDDGVVPISVDHNGIRDTLPPSLLVLGGKDMTHAAQVAFALFANVADENDVVVVLDLAIHHG